MDALVEHTAAMAAIKVGRQHDCPQQRQIDLPAMGVASDHQHRPRRIEPGEKHRLVDDNEQRFATPGLVDRVAHGFDGRAAALDAVGTDDLERPDIDPFAEQQPHRALRKGVCGGAGVVVIAENGKAPQPRLERIERCQRCPGGSIAPMRWLPADIITGQQDDIRVQGVDLGNDARKSSLRHVDGAGMAVA